MSRFGIFVLSLCFILSINLHSQPKIEIVGGDTYDWGTVKVTPEPLKAKILLKNAGGPDTLKVFTVRPGCGCTTAPLDKDAIAPGETATIDVTLNVSSYSDEVHKTVTITSNDPVNNLIILNLKAFVIQPVMVFPKFLNFGGAIANEESIGKVVIKNNTDKKITFKEIKIEPEELKVNFKKDDFVPAKGDFTIEAKILVKKEGSFRGNIMIKTDNEEAPKISIQVYGNARSKDFLPPGTIKSN
jgi:hypothetical protein